LLSAGCSLAQGYHYGRPVNADATTALLLHGKIDPANMLGETTRPAA